MRGTATHILLSLAFVVIQTTLARLLAVGTIVPDLPLLWIINVALRRGQAAATVTGFGIGLALDLLSGADSMLGLAALCKTVGGFLGGYFYSETRMLQTLGGYQSILVAVIVSVVHNLLYFLIFLQGSGLGWWATVASYTLPSTLYTAAVALLPMLVYARRTLS